jgi:hypothetical protein
VQLIRECSWKTPSAAHGSSRASPMFSKVFRDVEFYGVGYKVSGNTTLVDVRSLLENFFNMFLPAAYTKFSFFIRRKSSGYGMASLSTTLSGFLNYKTSG